MSTQAPRRSEILSLLSEACEVEHALACAYLFAAFSIRGGGADDGGMPPLTWQQQQRTKLWAAQVYFVASQEMLHLAQVWNILTAIGGTPYYGRPAFPLDRGYFPIAAPLVLAPYSRPTLERFLRWERPATLAPRRKHAVPATARTPATRPYQTVGELYERIQQLIVNSHEQDLFLGRPEHQVTGELVDFPDLMPVRTRDEARCAIQAIQAQGEGSPTDREDCHFGVFDDLLAAYPDDFAPARDVVENPVVRGKRPRTTKIIEPSTRMAMELFDDLYVLMLRMLSWSFGPVDSGDPVVRGMARAAIQLMPVVIKPLGEAITMLPAGHGGRAGPAFTLGRHVPLPLDASIAVRVASERIDEFRATADSLVRHHDVLANLLPTLPERIATVQHTLR